MTDVVIECLHCFDTKEIFNGEKMIPCSKCTDPSSLKEDYQEQKKILIADLLQNDDNTYKPEEGTEIKL